MHVVSGIADRVNLMKPNGHIGNQDKIEDVLIKADLASYNLGMLHF